MAQVMKDLWLRTEGHVTDVVWHFFKSPVTGKGGPTAPLKETLERFGIKIEFHF